MLSVSPEDLQKKGQANKLSCAKGLICYLGYWQLGLTGKELAEYFKISRSSVSPHPRLFSGERNLPRKMMLSC